MMQGEKVAADIREAHDNLSGDSAILPVLSAIARRLQRRMPQAPELDRTERPGARRGDASAGERHPGGRIGARRLRLRSARTGEMRRAAVRACAAWRASTRRRSTRCRRWRCKYADELAALEAGERARRRRSRPRRAPPPSPTPAPPRRCPRRASPPPRALETAVNAELPALKLERARFAVALEARRFAELGRRLRSRRVRRPDQSRARARVR